MITVIHYMNQFGAGFGSEDKADMKTGVFDGPKGPGTAFQEFFGDQAVIVKTMYMRKSERVISRRRGSTRSRVGPVVSALYM